jgi:hypothetical protein
MARVLVYMIFIGADQEADYFAAKQPAKDFLQEQIIDHSP